MKKSLIVILGMVMIGIALWAATPPARINYQGVVRDASGNPLNGLVTMTFRFYDDATAGTLLWEEIYDPTVYPPQITATGGLFTAALGDATHRNAGSETVFTNIFANHADLYLAVRVAGDEEMAPRVRVISAPFAENCDTLDGKHSTDFMDASLSGTFLDTSATPQTKAGKLTLNSATDYGIVASGPTAGGLIASSDGTGHLSVGLPNKGMDAYGATLGGSFCNGYGEQVYLAYIEMLGQTGVWASGTNRGGYFQDGDASDWASVGGGGYGIYANGTTAGGYFEDTNSSGEAWVGYSTYKISGTGTVSFVQNHPTEKDRVIVYACPEGDEVATYTRGTAKLINGEARVKLGETFQWVTNPDLGLTAHLTPKDDCKGLYATSVSTTEMFVKELNGGKSNAAFDYIVYGLRIGFEESSIVQEKQQESYIPSFKDHRERYAKYPQLRAFNSLERFKGMESSVSGVPESSIDLSRAKALKDAIHEYDPATDPPAEQLFGFEQKYNSDSVEQTPDTPLITSPRPPDNLPVVRSATENEAQSTSKVSGAAAADFNPGPLPCFPFSESVEAGDVVVIDIARQGSVRLCAVAADPMVVGIAAGNADQCRTYRQAEEASPSRVPLATSGLADCKVDASYGSIHEGDLLVSSQTPGHAMKALRPIEPGTVIGKALESLDAGTGTIKILVMLR